MTEQEFFAELKKIKDWKPFWGMIRRDRNDVIETECPITAVANARLGTAFAVDKWREAAIQLELDPEFASNVACAADGSPYTVRDKLLQACYGWQ